MAPAEVNQNVMQWQPKLLRLTMIGHPDIDGGEDTPCYVDPSLVCGVYRSMAQWHKLGSNELIDVPPIACTCVQSKAGHHYNVRETPDEVARLRDQALGHEKPTEPRGDVVTGPWGGG